MKCVLRFFLILIVLVVIGGGALLAYSWHWFTHESPREEMVVVEIPPGTGVRALTEKLATAQVIDQPLLFKGWIVARKQQGKLKAGEYAFPARISPQNVLERLVKGDTITHAMTLPEGLTTAQMLTMVAQDPRLSGEIPTGLPEGALMPDTYHFHRGDDRKVVVARMQVAMQKTLTELWKKRADNLPYATPQEALTMASIVERETGEPEERPRVAAVFVNRLRIGMPLQSDPTVVYGIEQLRGPMNRSLTRADLLMGHKYNTYVHGGLPPGPIASPGKAAIEAALNPPVSKELYFVATGTGGHYFSETLNEHNRNVAKYRAVLRQQKQQAQ